MQTSSGRPASRAYSPPIAPSSVGNSRTSSDAWSALASDAAWRASSPPPSLSTIRHEALRLLGEGPAALEERDLPEPARHLVDPDGDVAVERERRVVEAALEHADVARHDQLRLAASRDEREAVAAEREIALVRLHRRVDHATRKPEERLVERRFEHDRPLGHVHDLVELSQRVVRGPELVEPLDDPPAPLVLVGLDACRAQRIEISSGVGDLDSAGDEPAPERRLAGDRLAVELDEHPADGAREAPAVVAPPHRLREGKPEDELVELLLHDLGQRPPGQLDAEPAVALLERAWCNAVLAREAFLRRVRRARRRTGDPGRRRLGGRVLDEEGDAAGRDEDLRRLEPEGCAHVVAELGLGLVAGRGRKLLAADLNQQARHRASPGRALRP